MQVSAQNPHAHIRKGKLSAATPGSCLELKYRSETLHTAWLLSPPNTPRLASNKEIHYCKQDFGTRGNCRSAGQICQRNWLAAAFPFFISLNCMTRWCVVLWTISFFSQALFFPSPAKDRERVREKAQAFALWEKEVKKEKLKTHKTFNVSCNLLRLKFKIVCALPGRRKKSSFLFIIFSIT